jgi:hypothetical protein
MNLKPPSCNHCDHWLFRDYQISETLNFLRFEVRTKIYMHYFQHQNSANAFFACCLTSIFMDERLMNERWMNDTPLPPWLMHITCTSCYKRLKNRMRRGRRSTTTLARSVGSENVREMSATNFVHLTTKFTVMK